MRFGPRAALAWALMLTAGTSTAQPAAAPAPPPAAEPQPAALLGSLQPGLWHVRMVDGSADPARDICVADARQLVQLRHGAATCERFVAADEPRVATVSYTCKGTGSGRTSLRLGEGGLVRIDSQGIANRAPFAFIAEARRTGDCPAPATAAAPAAPAPAPAPDKPAPPPPGR